jgi:hypothetical protein
VFLQADLPAQQLPDWIWPPVLIIIGLAVVLGVLNQIGVVYSGREHKAALKGKDERIGELKAELAQERLERAADAQAMSTIKLAAQIARGAMADAAERLDSEPSPDPYEHRVAPGRRRDGQHGRDSR